MEDINKNQSFFARLPDKERTGARSQQSSRKSQRKYEYVNGRHSIDLLMANKRSNLDQLMESPFKLEGKEKPSRNNFEIQHVIGKGGFGKVWRV